MKYYLKQSKMVIRKKDKGKIVDKRRNEADLVVLLSKYQLTKATWMMELMIALDQVKMPRRDG